MKMFRSFVENATSEQKEHVNKKFTSIETTMEDTQKAIATLVSEVSTIK